MVVGQIAIEHVNLETQCCPRLYRATVYVTGLSLISSIKWRELETTGEFDGS